VTKTELRVSAVEIVEEYLRGRMRKTEESLTHEERTSFHERLLARCPQFSTRDYRSALTAAFAGRIRLAPVTADIESLAPVTGAGSLPRRGARGPRGRRWRP
jgi:hypothetical protein